MKKKQDFFLLNCYNFFTGKPPSWTPNPNDPRALTMKELMKEATGPHSWVDKNVGISEW